MKYCLFIPSTPEHFKYVDKILNLYKNGTIQPDEIIISLSLSQNVNNNELLNIENRYNCKILRHKKLLLSGPNRQMATNSDSEIIMYHDSDDFPHKQRIEIIKHYFEHNEDLLHFGHFFDNKNNFNNDYINIKNIKHIDNDIIHNKYFPNNNITECVNYTRGFGGNIDSSFGAHGGAFSIKKEILNKVKWKDRKDLYFSPGWNISSYRGAEDYEFHMECLFYLKKSMIIDSKIYFY